MRSEFSGSVISVRAVEDCIRATGKYTKGAFKRHIHHPEQGEDFPSTVLIEYYEVYPDLDLDQQMPFWRAVAKTADWLWGDTPRVDVQFKYNYPDDKAWVIVRGGVDAVQAISQGIPGFEEMLDKVVLETHVDATKEGQTVGNPDRLRAGSIPRP